MQVQVLEIINTNVGKVRLTLTPSRITIKYPLEYPEDKKELVKEQCLSINKKMGPLTKSFRGHFFMSDRIIMSNDSQTENIVFKYKEL